MANLFTVHIPKYAINEGGYLEDADKCVSRLSQADSVNNLTFHSSSSAGVVEEEIDLERNIHEKHKQQDERKETENQNQQKRSSKTQVDLSTSSTPSRTRGSSSCSTASSFATVPRTHTLPGEVNLQRILHELLTIEWGVAHPQYCVCMDQKTVKVQFTIPQERTEFILGKLVAMGIGENLGQIWVSNLEVMRPKVADSEKNNAKTMLADKQFLSSIKSRMVVEKVVETATRQAELSFDYLALVVIASSLAFLGLAYNNVVVIVASMLVSPIMGPVVAVTFGTIIRDWKLVKTGIISELISLAICSAVGLFLGLLFISFGESLKWPTSEMIGRGTAEGLLSGILVAIPSGIGVALSILGNNTSSLVGVAISASLLPPAVNFGLLIVIGIFGLSSHDDIFMKAFVSLMLTMGNILAIFLMALLMFKIKEVAPIPGKARFWKEDVKMTREYNAVVKGDEAAGMAQQLRDLRRDTESGPANNALTLSNFLSMRSIVHAEGGDQTSSDNPKPVPLVDLFHDLNSDVTDFDSINSSNELRRIDSSFNRKNRGKN